jgi:nickel/cobalt transporter (NicO) family protein
MDATLQVGLLTTAAFLGFFHTLTGPDHYLPFIAMSRVGRWSLSKTLAVAAACGVAHVLSSVLLGFAGIALTTGVTELEWMKSRLTWIEGVRGDLAAWLLLSFGIVYTIWGLRRAIRNRPHTHVHVHPEGTVHRHFHTHADEHAHVHADQGDRMTPWVLFVIFVFGPCEPLIPLLMFPALRDLNLWAVGAVALVFSTCTLATMLTLVTAGYYGAARLSAPWLTRYAHPLAGASLALCGLAMVLGL